MARAGGRRAPSRDDAARGRGRGSAADVVVDDDDARESMEVGLLGRYDDRGSARSDALDDDDDASPYPPPPSRAPRSALFTASLSLTMTAVGSTMLSLPAAFAQCGWALGLAVLLLFATLVDVRCVLYTGPHTTASAW